VVSAPSNLATTPGSTRQVASAVRRSRRIPLPLLVVLAATFVMGLAWTFAVPALQGADEGGHFAYVQQIADAHHVPWTNGPTLERDNPGAVSGEQLWAWTGAGLQPLRGNLADRPLWTPADEQIYDAGARGLPRGNGASNPAFNNPPLYYLSAVVPYDIVGGSFFDRLYALRLYNVVLLVLLVALTWLIAGEVFGRRRELQFVAAAAVALQPVLLDVTTKVTPDALLGVLAGCALYLMALIVNRGPSWRLIALLALSVAAAAFTHVRGVGLAPPALLAVGLSWWRHRAPRSEASAHRSRPAWIPVAVWAGVAFLVLIAVSAYATRWQWGQLDGFWSYLWQFYLPRLPGMTTPLGPAWGADQVYLDRFLATFVQFEVGFPNEVRDWLRLGIYAGLVLVVVAAWRHRRVLGQRRDVVVVMVVAIVLVILSLHAAAFNALLVNPADPVITGRYILMLVPLFGVGVAAGMSALSGRARAVATGALLAGGFLLQLTAFGLIVARFYA
jgi:4-amino-4-deoxy-L-arabinose transferase-like glycosyltransferase